MQTFKMPFQCVMWITRHSSIWIAKNSIHCSLPTLSSSVAMYSVMRDKPDARKVPMERGWVVLYLYATCKFSNLLTLEQWAFEYGLPFFLYALYKWICIHFGSPSQVYIYIDCPNKNANQTFGINNFQNYESI